MTSVAREDIVALLTLPLAALCFAAAEVWLANVHRHADRPVSAKRAELVRLQDEARQLDRADTFAKHGKKVREIAQVEADIAEMTRRRQTTRRTVILTAVHWFLQCVGLIVLRFAIRYFGNRRGSESTTSLSPLSEIVMVPHLFTSTTLDVNPQAVSDTRVPIVSWVGGLRSLDYIVWYCCCLVTVRVLMAAFWPARRQ